MIIHKIHNACICLILCICTTNLLATPTPPIQYQPTFLPSSKLVGVAMNNLGEVIGTGGYGVYFFYANGTALDLEKLTGIYEIESISDINDHSQILFKGSKTPGAAYLGYIFSVFQKQLQTIQNAGLFLSINNAGQVVGCVSGSDYCANSYDVCAAIFFTNKACQVLNRQKSNATHINDFYGPDGLGQIVGTYQDTAFLYSNGTMNVGISPTICPQSTDDISQPILNNIGQIAGDCGSSTGPEHYQNVAFIYNATEGSTEYMSNHEIAPIAINDSGWLIGVADVNTNHAYPFLMIKGSMYDIYRLINTSYPITQLTLVDINNKGQILANTENSGAVILTPVCDANGCY